MGIYEPQDDAGHRQVWVVCGQTEQSRQPIVRIEPKTLAFSLYNLWQPRNGEPEPNWKEFPRALQFRPEPYSLNDHTLLTVVNSAIAKLPMGPQQFEFTHAQPVFKWPDFSPPAAVLPVDGKLYYAGREWFRIDSKSLAAEDLGPGLRLNGKLVDFHIAYAVSAHLGMCGFSATDGCFYRFSADPAHPLATRGTLDPPAP